jgi:hypothetical protein
MPHDADIERVAADYVRERGLQVVDWLHERAELADSVDDHASAEIWREIADAANSLLESN